MPLLIDITHPAGARETILGIATDIGGESSATYAGRLFDEVEALFTGRSRDYQANNTSYHDLRHTLQVTLVYAELINASQHRTVMTALSPRQFELGLTAALLHDSGYLKLRSDLQGTGAKYTYCHVLRGCSLAASLLPSFGLTTDEIAIVLSVIRNTAPAPLGAQLKFSSHEEQTLASAVSTADYLAQMGAADYPDKLPCLFAEFVESDAFLNLPPERRAFRDLAQLVGGTSAFWTKLVKPRLEKDFNGFYHVLDAPDGTNSYLDAIERNLRTIAARATATPAN